MRDGFGRTADRTRLGGGLSSTVFCSWAVGRRAACGRLVHDRAGDRHSGASEPGGRVPRAVSMEPTVSNNWLTRSSVWPLCVSPKLLTSKLKPVFYGTVNMCTSSIGGNRPWAWRSPADRRTGPLGTSITNKAGRL